jgi:hypothetical protein
MKYSIGDKVRLKRTGEEGTVLAFLGKDMLEVEVSGISFPVYNDDVEHPYLNWFLQKANRSKVAALPEEPPKQEKAPPVRLPQGVYLSFLPQYDLSAVEDIIREVKVHLVNELPYDLQYRYELREQGGAEFFSLDGSINAFANIYLHNVPWDVMAAQPRFHWHFVPVFRKEIGPPESGILRLKPQQLFRRINELEENGAPGFHELLVDQFVDRPQEKLSAPVFQVQPIKEPDYSSVSARSEIDLHAEILIGDIEGMSSGEILSVQVQALRDFIQEAIVHELRQVTIVHGLGSGALRATVEFVLQQFPEVIKFTSGWHPQYGFGATRASIGTKKR